MKKFVLMFIPALICGLAFTSCNAEKEEPKLITSDGLYVIGTKSGALPTSITDLVFTDDDIVSFDPTSGGEMVFTKEKTVEIISRARLHSVLHFFIDGKPVFSPPIKIYFGWGSLDDIDLQFRISDYDKIYLTDIYQHLDSLLVIDREILEIEFEANRLKRKLEMEVLIKYLSDAGKIVDRTELEEPSLPVTSDTLKHVIIGNEKFCLYLNSENMDKTAPIFNDYLAGIKHLPVADIIRSGGNRLRVVFCQ